MHPHSETGHIRLRQHSLHHKFRKLRLYTFAGACRKANTKANRSKSSVARVISNFEGDRLREVDVAKVEERRQRDAARATRGG